MIKRQHPTVAAGPWFSTYTLSLASTATSTGRFSPLAAPSQLVVTLLPRFNAFTVLLPWSATYSTLPTVFNATPCGDPNNGDR